MNIWNPFRWHLKSKTAKLTTSLTLFHFKAFTTRRLPQGYEVKYLNNALKVLDLVSPKTALFEKPQIHLQLVQDFLQAHSKHFTEGKSSNAFTSSVPKSHSSYDIKPSSISFEDDPMLVIFELCRRGLKVDSAVLPYALGACAFRGKLHLGVQLHCLAVRDGLFWDVYVGSSLISMYSKCGDLSSARLVFEEMPIRNIVSWSALISGFAQESHADVCLDLYRQMRNSSFKPNAYTLTSLLSSCVGDGSLRIGKSAHSQAIILGLDLYMHVANALISMYCKCGHVEDAFCVFETLRVKDIVSWNSMIAGYALHGLAWKAIDLFEDMRTQKMKPDAISFLGVLSSCRHAGLLNQGMIYFNSMIDDGVKPDLGHYSCIVDLLGRAGLVEEGRDLVLGMPIEPNAIIWGSLLSSCRLHDNVWIGIEAAENKLVLEPTCVATHMQLAKLYARVGLKDQVAKVLKMLKDTEQRSEPGFSWIEIGKEVHRFKAYDTSNSRMSDVLLMLHNLMDQMMSHYMPETDDE